MLMRCGLLRPFHVSVCCTHSMLWAGALPVSTFHFDFIIVVLHE